jgi:hypothetical protein
MSKPLSRRFVNAFFNLSFVPVEFGLRFEESPLVFVDSSLCLLLSDLLVKFKLPNFLPLKISDLHQTRLNVRDCVHPLQYSFKDAVSLLDTL